MTGFISQPTSGEDATAASAYAGERLEAQASRWPRVRRVARSLRSIRERNHFSELANEAFRSRR